MNAADTDPTVFVICWTAIILSLATMWVIYSIWPRTPNAPSVDVTDALRSVDPVEQLRDCIICTRRHCAGCVNPVAVLATDTGHIPRHDFSEVPPSLAWLASVVHVSFRARLVADAVGPRWTPKPYQSRAAFEVWASQRLGRPFQTTPKLGWALP
jgi:hypothetical protein